MSEDVNLLPCPFCGSAPAFRFVRNGFVVACGNDACDASPRVRGSDRAEAEAHWNQRAEVALPLPTFPPEPTVFESPGDGHTYREVPGRLQYMSDDGWLDVPPLVRSQLEGVAALLRPALPPLPTLEELRETEEHRSACILMGPTFTPDCREEETKRYADALCLRAQGKTP